MTTLNDWQYLKRPGFEARPLRVAIVGAGASGICLAIKILEAQTSGLLSAGVEVVIYERDSDYGGTWAANRYPGCRCDIPSHVYQFSFAPYADWSHFYSPAAEINEYMHMLAEKYKVTPLIKLNHSLVGAAFDESSGKWNLSVNDSVNDLTTVNQFDVFVPATGVLSQVNRPKINGLENFTKNPILHTAEWPKDLDFKTAFKDENVAVIGIGSSGLQTIGAIAPFVKSCSIFARSKFYISPEFITEPAGQRDWVLGNFAYPEAEKEMFATNKEKFLEHVSALTAGTMSLFGIFYRGSVLQEYVKDLVKVKMAEGLRNKPDLMAKLIPDFDIWCRRVTPSEPFMNALHQDNIHLLNSGIVEVTAQGIQSVDGTFSEVDRIILATGFDTSFKPKYPIEAKGNNLADVWATRPKAYMSLAVTGFPNMLIQCGPGTIFANGSLLSGIEASSAYIVKALTKLQTQDIKYMEVDFDAQKEYNIQQEAVMQDLVFSGDCSSWYKGGSATGKPDAIFSGSSLQFMEMLENPRWEDWNFKSLTNNRFSFLGNGTGTIEATNGNKAWYLKVEEHANPLRKGDYPSTLAFIS